MAAREPEVLVIEAGPAGLWTVFQLAIHGIRSLILESAAAAGGQCAQLYADKPVHDLPGFGAIDAGKVVDLLLGQIARFEPDFRFNTIATSIMPSAEGFEVATAAGETFRARHVILATGIDAFCGRPEQRLELPAGLVLLDGKAAVSSATFATSIEGLYCIGDAAHYPGKLPLLVSAFHEAALAAFAIRSARGGARQAMRRQSKKASVTGR